MQLIFVISIVISLVPLVVNANTSRFPAAMDVWISAYPGEENYNMGASTKLKLKGIQEMAILDFDLSSLRGKNVERARLFLRDAAKDNKLRKIGVYTVASPWVEGKSRGYIVDIFGNGASFNYSSYKKQRWAGKNSDLTDVTIGNGNTWQHHVELQREDDQWWSIDIHPDLIHALIAEKSHGLMIMDESGQTFANNYVFSRESKYLPYIVIEFSESQKKKPQRLNVELSSSFHHAHLEYGAVVLKFPIQENIFAFDMFINGDQVPLWRVPKPEADSLQEIIIDWLPPEKKVSIKILAVDELGQRSEPVTVTGYASNSLPRIDIPDAVTSSLSGKKGNKSRLSNGFRVWAVPDIIKVDPVSGRVYSELNADGFDVNNSIWSEDEREITLSGVKGEIIAFQLCVEAGNKTFNNIELEFTPLTNDKGSKISDERLSLYQIHYLKIKDKWYPELAIPMTDGMMNKNVLQQSIQGQENQSVYIELSIPPEIKQGSYKGEISILQKGDLKETLRVKLQVADISMPGKLSFVPELNMYKGPGRAGTERFFNAHRIAHEHRAVINRVPYSQDGRVHKDMIPQISYLADGRIEIDWSGYDRRLGPLFDGTAFTNGERKGIPVEKFYLPFFENWPTPLASNYKYREVETKTQKIISEHALEAPPIDKGMTLSYHNRFISIVREFKKHFEEKGWNSTEFQFYLNNKWKWKGASSWWNLDEPLSYDDWMALKNYGLLFTQGRGETEVPFIFRADISRPPWQSDWLNGLLDRMYVNTKVFFRFADRVRKIKKEGNINYSVYGSLNNIASSNQQSVLWCMKAFVEGADGALPWQSLGGPKAFTIPDRNALIVDARKELGIDWVVSLRVKALRRGQQNVELLAMLEKKYGYSREQIRDFFYRYFGIKDNDDMNSLISKEIDTNKMENFRKLLIEML